jgi:integrase
MTRDEKVAGSFTRFVEGHGLDPVLDVRLVEAYTALGLPGRSAPTKGTYRSVLRKLGADRPRPAPGYVGSVAGRPYSSAERRELYSMASSQPKQWRRHSALAMIALGLGAGLRAGEISSLRGADVLDGSVAVAGRVVVVRPPYAEPLAELATAVGSGGFVFHPEPAVRSYHNFVNDFLANLDRSRSCPPLSVRRLRASYISELFADGVPLSEILELTGIKEVESLIRYTRVLPGLPQSKAGLRARLRAELGA